VSTPGNRAFQILREYSAFLITGSVLAVVWANLDLASYQAFINTSWGNITLFGRDLAHHGISLHFLVNEVFMVFFFGIAMKEVMEAFLPGGPLSSVRKAGLPIVSTLGGVAGPAGLFALGCFFFAKYLIRGWAVPTATDIAYSWLFAGMIFGYKHPATKFLLTLAVLDDLIGMVIIAVFYSSSIQLPWLALVGLAMVLCALMRWVAKVDTFWPYIIIGLPLSWLGLHYCGVHSALALVPIVPFLPSFHGRDVGLFEEEDLPMDEGKETSSGEGALAHATEGHHPIDALNMFEHLFKPYVDVGLLFFGLCNAGVPFAAIGLETWITVLAIFVGKTGGIYLFTVIGRACRLGLPAGMNMKEAFVMGNVAAIGFTVALFVTDVAFPKKLIDDQGGGHALSVPSLVSVAHAEDADTEPTHGTVDPDEVAAETRNADNADAPHMATPHAPASGAPKDPHEDQSFDDLTPDQQQVVKDKVKMGALLSFFAGLTSLLLGRLLGVRKINTDADLQRAIRENS
jgi:NhaA family Na+:H+ antiporter